MKQTEILQDSESVTLRVNLNKFEKVTIEIDAIKDAYGNYYVAADGKLVKLDDTELTLITE